ncbi:MAG: hypothetical protein NDJ92_08865 [Thermoanaerobaculia bacterium]|nr:hypothetical protein [Thermoanaerobaculia bacterium]
MIVALLVAIVTSQVSFSPAKPTVGDAITVRMQGMPFEVRPSAEIEIVSASPDEVVLRTFRPGPLRVEYETRVPGEAPATGSMQIEIASVLARDDELEPAPLRPPKPLPRDDAAWVAIGVAAGVALLLWLSLALLLRRRVTPAQPQLPAFGDPADSFRAALARIRSLDDDEAKWIALASATRTYLAATDASLGVELTTSELLLAMRRSGRRNGETTAVESILRGGDWTKFSPFGAPQVEIASLVDAAAKLIPARVEREAAA